MKIVSFTIFKGGTGKTTSSVNTAVALVRRGKRVLLVDLDQQASATRYLSLDPESLPSLYQVFLGARSAANAIRQTRVGVDMLTANTYLAAVEQALEPGDELKLAGILRPLKADYDFIILDSPPGKARLNFNALAASDLIVITCAAERMALDGVADTIGYIQRHMWGKYPELEHQELRILFTMYRNTTSHAPAVAASAQKIWRDNIFGVRIPHAAIFAQSYDQKQPVVDIAPRHPGALAYDALAQLLIPMKTPKLDDFDQTPKRPIRELHSPIDDMPRIQKPTGHPQPPPRPRDNVAASPGDDIAASPLRRTTSKRLLVRRGFDYYDDQLARLKKLSLREQMAGRDGSMSRMLREALDHYLAKQHEDPDTT